MKDGKKTPAEDVKTEKEVSKSANEEVAKAEAQAADNQEVKEVSENELSDIIKSVVADQFEQSKEELKGYSLPTSEDLTKSIQSAFDEVKKGIEDAEQAKQAVAGQISEIAKSVFKQNFENLRKEKKSIHNVEESKNPVIERPESKCEGNMPLWIKQLDNKLKGKHEFDGVPSDIVSKAQRDAKTEWKKGGKGFNAVTKAITSVGSGTGAEWVPSDLSSAIQKRFFLASNLATFMLSNEIEMPTEGYKFPVSTTRPTFHVPANENTATTASTPGSAELVLTTSKYMAQVDYSYESEEDSIVDVAETIVGLIGEAAAATVEDYIINGDTTATHQDNDTNGLAASNHLKHVKGLRKYALAGSLATDISSGGISVANLLALKTDLGKYGVNPSDLAFIVSPAVYNKFLGLSDVLTVERFSLSNATIIEGVIDQIFGIPIIVSEAMRDDLAATGVNTSAGPNNTGAVLLVNHRQFMFGRRRGFTIETDRDISTQTYNIVASFRRDFKPIETPSASVSSVAYGYNLTI